MKLHDFSTTRILIGSLFLLILSIFNGKANDVNSSFNVKLERVENTMRFKLLIKSEDQKKVLISVKNEFGEEIINEEVKPETEIERIYDFSTMEAGNYKVEVRKGNKKITNLLSNYTLRDGKTIFNVVFVSNRPAKTYSILMYNQARDKVKLELVNSDKEVVFKQLIDDQESFGRNYNFSQLKPGNYILEVSRADKKFTKLITIE